MWKKPSIELPDFKKSNLKEILEGEAIETNGGSISNLVSTDLIQTIPPTRPPGRVSETFNFKE
ncbi:hypothetical protein IAI10_12875 [Clostridium sp. 19966]|uniref:hypothetical protein n=1 Tax=Clostridium sp. 19966 TaxID=2768166 RepID=UPI0028DDE715|nr:hypothetical protein [Clostridium sp. 19966]MDT8717558.1 hypothetical protein [Clostridium sp. 19966]